MHTKLITTLAFGTLVVLTASASAFPVQYEGTRGDVRALCTGEENYLLEGGNFSQCFTPYTDVLCRDDGTCSSPNFDLARAAGYQRVQLEELASIS